MYSFWSTTAAACYSKQTKSPKLACTTRLPGESTALLKLLQGKEIRTQSEVKTTIYLITSWWSRTRNRQCYPLIISQSPSPIVGIHFVSADHSRAHNSQFKTILMTTVPKLDGIAAQNGIWEVKHEKLESKEEEIEASTWGWLEVNYCYRRRCKNVIAGEIHKKRLSRTKRRWRWSGSSRKEELCRPIWFREREGCVCVKVKAVVFAYVHVS